jgi:hypothetical protein
MRFARGDVRGPHRFTQKRPRTFVAALQSFAVVRTSKYQLSRDFRRGSNFDFCNTISLEADIVRGQRQVRKGAINRSHRRSFDSMRVDRTRISGP